MDPKVAQLATQAAQRFSQDSPRAVKCKKQGSPVNIVGPPAVTSACSQACNLPTCALLYSVPDMNHGPACHNTLGLHSHAVNTVSSGKRPSFLCDDGLCLSSMVPLQVVAGTNYDITFYQKVQCRGQAPSPVVLEALVYEPLPIAGNMGTVVQSVHELR